MKENSMIIQVQLLQSKSSEPTFYNGLDKHILYAVLGSMDWRELSFINII